MLGFAVMDYNVGFAVMDYNVGFAVLDYNVGFAVMDYNVGFAVMAYNVGFAVMDYNVGFAVMAYNVGFAVMDYNVGFAVMAYNVGFAVMAYNVGFAVMAYNDFMYLFTPPQDSQHRCQQDVGCKVQTNTCITPLSCVFMKQLLRPSFWIYVLFIVQYQTDLVIHFKYIDKTLLGHTKLINCSSDAAHLKIAKVKKNILIFFCARTCIFVAHQLFFLVISAMPLNNSTSSF